MSKKFYFLLYATAILQLLSAFFHSLSFFAEQKATNASEQQLMDLMQVKTDMGAGFTPSMHDLFIGLSSCFTMLYAFGGWLLIYLKRKHTTADLLKGVLGIYTIVFGVAFVIMYRFTFLPPIVLTGLVFLGCISAYFSAPKNIGSK